MSKRDGWRAALTGGAIGASSLFGGCDTDKGHQSTKVDMTYTVPSSPDDQNRIDLVHKTNPNAVAVSSTLMLWPKALRSDPQGEIIDLTDPKQVAKAVGIELNGKPDQLLYEIQIGRLDERYGLTTENFIRGKTIPITVSNIQEGANLINSLAGQLVSERPVGRDRSIAPEKGAVR